MHIGVVIPAYDAAHWIADAVASVRSQTHRDWRLVVVDDGSTDGTGAVVAAFDDPRIRLIRQDNAGVSAARNRGFAELCGIAPVPRPTELGVGPIFPLLSRDEAAGKEHAVLFLDADDRLAPDALARLAAALDAHQPAVAASGACAFVDTGTIRWPPSGDILRRLLVRNLFANGGHVLIRADAARRAGGFLPALRYGEDWEYLIRIALQGPFAAAPGRSPVLHVRQHASGAFRRAACDPASFSPCMAAIFGNPTLVARFGAARLASLIRRTEAENAWTVGRELVRGGRLGEGRAWLARSVLAHPTAKRLTLLLAVAALPLLPARLWGPWLPYPQETVSPG
ncbi:MAG TPA: glycosyltransferase family A protein [Acetobacteraceae bacterium]|nr:glycosyltransferase family A protein [Acetobacteraceae bacterium]